METGGDGMTAEEREDLVGRLLVWQKEGHPVRLVLLSGNVVGGENSILVGFQPTSLFVRLVKCDTKVKEKLTGIVSFADVPISHIDYIESLAE